VTAAVFCQVDPARAEDRKRLRGDHLAYIAAHREIILAGGPVLTSDGAPETMILLLNLPGVPDAEAFIRAEPYTANGVFRSVEVKPWARVLPEAHPGDLDAALALEKRHG